VSRPDAIERFEREARSAGSLNHPNIVTIYELGRFEDAHYIAMELVEGETVRKLTAAGPIAFPKAVAIAAQIADAIAKAHEVGIVHRDLKPENIMVTAEGAVKFWTSVWPSCSRRATARRGRKMSPPRLVKAP
jgi:serine/threonine-protein kinase